MQFSSRLAVSCPVRVHRFRCKNIDRSCHTNGRSRAGDEARSRAVGQIGLGAGRCGRWRPAHGSSCRAEAEHRWQRPMEGWRPGHAARRPGGRQAGPQGSQLRSTAPVAGLYLTATVHRAMGPRADTSTRRAHAAPRRFKELAREILCWSSTYVEPEPRSHTRTLLGYAKSSLLSLATTTGASIASASSASTAGASF